MQIPAAHNWDTIWFVTNNADDPKRTQVYGKAWGEDTVKAMRGASGANVDGVIVRHIGSKALSLGRASQVILATYPAQDMLSALDALRQFHAVVVVPYWQHDETWDAKWHAEPI